MAKGPYNNDAENIDDHNLPTEPLQDLSMNPLLDQTLPPIEPTIPAQFYPQQQPLRL